MTKWTYYGGPLDGAEVPHIAHSKDYVYTEMEHQDGSITTYYYIRCDDHGWFEYAGEVEVEDE